ncbi:MAG TPA: cob(I)yrinic acid a,c-diamide adenosyltransferase [Acidovorax sp.]|nr:cob(I)yrinic acid a,c-diamide adenosyltransferase [Acidovorax sp.]
MTGNQEQGEYDQENENENDFSEPIMSTLHKTGSESEHREAMQNLQAEMREKMRAAQEKRGLIIVHTGNGKGKTTAAFGMLVRMLAHGRHCAVIQFIKSGVDAVEKLLSGPNLSWHRIGDGFTWDTQNRAADIASCREGWRLAMGYLQSSDVDFVLLDELNIVLGYDYLPKDEVLAGLRAKRPEQHVVVTGRGALPELIDLADLVTEMKEIKHPFHSGVKAQRGIEF